MDIVVIVLFAAVVAFFWLRSNSKMQPPRSNVRQPVAEPTRPSGTRVRLTDQQIIALSSATFDKPIYGEDSSSGHAKTPAGAMCFNLRTIESLVTRGYLTSDGKGGYLLTPEGAAGLRSGMGF